MTPHDGITGIKRQTILYSLDTEYGKSVRDLTHITGFPPGFIEHQLAILKKDGKCYFDKEENCWFKTPEAQVVVNGVAISSLSRPAGTSVFQYRDEAAMWERVAAIKRIKQRLIEEYHPLLDAIIADYEWMLRKDDDDD